jgi:hypothetical protein
MTLRKILIIPFLVSVVFFWAFSSSVFADLRELIDGNLSVWLVAVPGVLGALAIQFAAHLLRAYKMKYLMYPTVPTSTSLQFRALSVGYLFNTILPFRIGELIRAQVVAYTKSVSFGYSLILIIVERLLDIILLLTGAGVLVVLAVFPGSIVSYLITAGIITLLIVLLLVAVRGEYVPLTRMIYKTSLLFNDSLKVQARFKYWTIMYGLRQSITVRRMISYGLLTVMMWVLYIASVWLLLTIISGGLADGKYATIPFYATSIPSGPANLGSYSNVYSELAATAEPIKTQALATWAFLALPMGLVGLFNLLRSKVPAWRKLQQGAETSDLINKLSRSRDISRDLNLFLENYFSGNTLSGIVNRRERGNDFKLLRFFKGGSDAITILVNKRRMTIVEKIISLELKDRLSAQYQWLVKHQDDNIVKALGEETADDFYAIELEYNSSNEMFFDYMHKSSLEDSMRVLDDVWSTLNRTVHKKSKKIVNTKGIREYIDKHFYQCLDKSLGVSMDLEAVVRQDTIEINGKTYTNAYALMEKILGNAVIMKDLASYASSGEVHGDVAVDNILIDRNTRQMTLIDPAPDGNIINGRVFDFGKNMQSLYCGYEFLFRSTDPAILGEDGSISYNDQRSSRYVQLCEYVRNELAQKYLTEAEQKAMLFHAGVLLIRRLKHQVYQDPQLTLSMYASGVKALNDFYELYR